MRFRVGLPAVVAFMLPLPLAAHDIITTNLTYSRDISRIFARRCAACHSESSSIPLTTYETVRPWAVDIKEQVLSRSMPPWGAVKGFGDLSPDGALTQEELLIIAAWVVGGAPQGNPALLPKRTIASTWGSAGEPRLRDALTVITRSELSKSLVLAGIRPLPETKVKSARVIARLPDGMIKPLVWLYGFDAKCNQVFRFREPIELPAGTVVESSAPLRFVLETNFEQPLATATKLSPAQ